MAEQPPAGGEYTLTKENGETGKSSRDYTGKGKATYPNGDIYDGEFVKGLREGKGKYTYANGDEYDGEFKENNKHGIGRIVYKTGGEAKGEYYGRWVAGKKQGDGVFKYINKDIYSGYWKNGKKDGKGTYIFADTGTKVGFSLLFFNCKSPQQITTPKLIGEWAGGEFVKGKWMLTNGTYFEGVFDKNMPKGTGKWVFSTGNQVAGVYR